MPASPAKLAEHDTLIESKMTKANDQSPKTPRVTAETMATKQRDISVSEFFAKNRHLLGFDNPRKAVLTTVKEAVDNSLDACEEAGILPDITVVIEDLEPSRPASAKSSKYRITVVDNGPGIVRKQVENVFGRLLFGSKFHRLKMSRGQQGIGISAAGMYGLITTGKPMLIQTRPSAGKKAHHIELAMNTKTNRAEVTVDEETDDFPLARLRDLSSTTRELADKGELLSHAAYPTGTSVTIDLEGKYQRGRGSVDEFLELTAIANPHARITLIRPTRVTEEDDDAPLMKRGSGERGAGSGEGQALAAGDLAQGDLAAATAAKADAVTADLGSLVIFPRGIEQLPPETKEIQPHPRGVELGTLLQMLKDYEANEKGGTLYNFLQEKFCRISPQTAGEFCKAIGCSSRTKAGDVEPPQAEKLYKEFQEAKLAPPPTDCLAPIGVQQLLRGMFKGVRAEFYAASSREASVYRGRPFLIESAIAFGGELPTEDTARVIRFANRVPLLFQQSACSSFKAVTETNWRNYDLQHPRGGLPIGPLVIMIHMASVWVPFTSESKEAIADYDEIRKEMKLALMECGRKLGTYLRKRAKMKREGERRDVFERYIGEISKAISAITEEDTKKLYESLLRQARERTAIADAQLDDEGKTMKDDPQDQEGVLIIAGDDPSPPVPSIAAARPAQAHAQAQADAQTKAETKAGSSVKGARAAKELTSKAKRTARDDDDADIFKASKAEAAALKVAALAADDAPARPSAKHMSKKPEAKPASKPETKSEAQPAGKAEKPRVRLVNGKPVPIQPSNQQPRLF